MSDEQPQKSFVCLGDCVDKTCINHTGTQERLHHLEGKMVVVENNTATVAKLTARVNLLLLLISFGTTAVIGGAVYTFTGLSRFKDIYSADRISLQQQLSSMQQSNNLNLNNGLKELNVSLNNKLGDLDTKVDARLDQLSDRITKLEGAVDNFRGGWPSTTTKKPANPTPSTE